MKVFRNPDAVWREEDAQKEKVLKGLEAGEDISDSGTSIVLLHGKMHALNLLGTEVWKLCDGRTPDEIVSELRELFDVDAETLAEDVRSFIVSLKELGIIYEK